MTEERIARFAEGLARGATRRNFMGRLLRAGLGAGLALVGGSATFAEGRCRRIKGGCGTCAGNVDGCGGFVRCQRWGYHCDTNGLDCPSQCLYKTFWSCCCDGIVYRCTDCYCGGRVCICRGSTGNEC